MPMPRHWHTHRPCQLLPCLPEPVLVLTDSETCTGCGGDAFKTDGLLLPRCFRRSESLFACPRRGAMPNTEDADERKPRGRALTGFWGHSMQQPVGPGTGGAYPLDTGDQPSQTPKRGCHGALQRRGPLDRQDVTSDASRNTTSPAPGCRWIYDQPRTPSP